MRTRTGRAYEHTTLAAIAADVAKRNGLQVTGKIESIAIQRATQVFETDLAFLRRIADEYGYSFNVRAKQLVFFRTRELRDGKTRDGKTALKTPTGNLSTAEAIAVMVGGLSQCHHFGNGRLAAEDLSANLVGAIVKDPVQDRAVLEEYLETVLKKRSDYAAYYRAMLDVL